MVQNYYQLRNSSEIIKSNKTNSHWFEQDTVRPDPSCVLLLPVRRYQLFDINWFRYLVVVNVYKIGFTAEFSGSTNTTRNAYKSAESRGRTTNIFVKLNRHQFMVQFKLVYGVWLTRNFITEKHRCFHSNNWNPA